MAIRTWSSEDEERFRNGRLVRPIAPAGEAGADDPTALEIEEWHFAIARTGFPAT